jgi:hypothetical protein
MVRLAQELQMIVGRTLWDFILEVMQAPGLRAATALVFLGILFLEMLPMAYSGSMELNISYGGFQSALP